MASPVGPRRLTSQHQVSVPVRLLRELELGAGDAVYFSLSEGEPRRIILIPADQVSDGQEKVAL